MNSYGVPADVAVRLVAGLLLGAVVGVEREATEQAAGLRTHVAVCLGAALFGVISTTGFDELRDVRANTNINIDVTRVASNVAVGVGFLGAGIIFREGTTVRNLTTAASMWAVAAIGLAAGVGDIGTAALATALTVAYLVLLRPLRSLIRQRARSISDDLSVTFRPQVGLDVIHALVDEAPGIRRADLRVDKHDDRLVMHLALREPRRAHRREIDRFIAELLDRPEVQSLERR